MEEQPVEKGLKQDGFTLPDGTNTNDHINAESEMPTADAEVAKPLTEIEQVVLPPGKYLVQVDPKTVIRPNRIVTKDGFFHHDMLVVRGIVKRSPEENPRYLPGDRVALYNTGDIPPSIQLDGEPINIFEEYGIACKLAPETPEMLARIQESRENLFEGLSKK